MICTIWRDKIIVSIATIPKVSPVIAPLDAGTRRRSGTLFFPQKTGMIFFKKISIKLHLKIDYPRFAT